MKQLFLSTSEQPSYRAAFTQVAQRLGVDVVPALTTPYVLPLSNGSARALSQQGDINYMPADAFSTLSDCCARGASLPALPAVQDKGAIMAMTGPVFVKPRLNVAKGQDSLSYTRWGSGAELCASMWDMFSSQEQGLGGLVATPDMGTPMTSIELDFAVNAQHQVYVMHVFTHGFTAHNRPTNMVSGATAPAELLAAVEQYCITAALAGGIYNIQAVQHEGSWKIMDWNCRPSGMYNLAAGYHAGVADAGVAHMMGLPVTETPVHIELRSYWDTPVDSAQAEAIRALGLIPSWVWDRSCIGRVYGIGDTAEAVQAKFAVFEETFL